MSKAYDSNEITRAYYDSLLIETRYIDSDLPDTSIELFGHKYDMPIATAALSHLHSVCDNGMREFALGAKNANALCFIGMGEDEDLEEMADTGADIVKIIKPHENDVVVFDKIEHAVKTGAVAVGMDIDHSYNGNGGYDVVLGLPMKPKSFDALKAFIDFSPVPFIVKGVLSVSDAKKCAEAGAAGIIVSHHHGIMPYSVPPAMVLPNIKKAIGKDMRIFIDCGIESGMDVFKALALGADAVCIGRDLMEALKGGNEAVAKRMIQINNEFKSIMARTGAKTLAEIDPSVIHHRNF